MNPSPQIAHRFLWGLCGGFILLLGLVYLLLNSFMGNQPTSSSVAPATQTSSGPTPVPAFATIKEFEADIFTHDNKGNDVRAHIFVHAGNVRSQMTIHGTDAYIIMRKDQQKIYVAIPSLARLLTFNFNDKLNFVFNSDDPGQWTKVGEGTMNQIPCTHYSVVDPQGKLNDVWVDTAKQVPVVIERHDGSYRVDWSNFQPKNIDDSLFIPPSNYQVIDQPFALPDLPGDDPNTPPTPAPDQQLPNQITPEQMEMMKKLFEHMQQQPVPPQS